MRRYLKALLLCGTALVTAPALAQSPTETPPSAPSVLEQQEQLTRDLSIIRARVDRLDLELKEAELKKKLKALREGGEPFMPLVPPAANASGVHAPAFRPMAPAATAAATGPVVDSLRGREGEYRATIQLGNGTYVNAVKGQTLPGGLHVIAVSADGVRVSPKPDGKDAYNLPFASPSTGTAVMPVTSARLPATFTPPALPAIPAINIEPPPAAANKPAGTPPAPRNAPIPLR